MFSKLKLALVAALSLNSAAALAETPEISPEDFISNIPAPSVEELTEQFDDSLDFNMQLQERNPDSPTSMSGFSAIFTHTIIPEGSHGATGKGPFSYCIDHERAIPLLRNLAEALELTENELIDKPRVRQEIQDAIEFCTTDPELDSDGPSLPMT